jgi:hypothetical protein
MIAFAPVQPTIHRPIKIDAIEKATNVLVVCGDAVASLQSWWYKF